MPPANDPLIALIRSQSTPFEPIPTGLAASESTLEGIRHISFDVYGTLIASGVGDIGNSAPADRGTALLSTLKRVSTGTLPDPAFLEETFLGEIRSAQEKSQSAGALRPEVEIREVWKHFLNKVGIPSVEESKLEEFALRFELAVNPVWPMPGLVETLRGLSPSFAPFSIVSNAQFFTPLLFPALLGQSLSDLGFEESLCVWSYQKREAKPSPRLFEDLLNRLGPSFHPSEVLYVGNDRLNDVSAAKKAGLRTALFAGDQRSLRLRENHPDCRGIEPDWILTSLGQLLRLNNNSPSTGDARIL
jgi:putative hydrolase of the HAD superfamily